MAKPAVTIVKSFTYRGNPEEFSNTYHFDSIPADDAAWATLVGFVRASEQTIYPDTVFMERAIGYDDGDGHHSPTYHEDLAHTACTYTITGVQGPGDAAAWVRWGTGRLSSGARGGKPVYLRKYLHAVDLEDAGPEDTFTGSYSDALDSFRAGIGAGGSGFQLAGPDYSIADPMVGSITAPFVTTRTLKRRGRRPT